MTERLYYADSYLTTFRARVVTSDGTRVTLDRTAFYPTSGGQPFDTGTLDGRAVVDVVDAGDAVVHVLDDGTPFAVGADVTGQLDWARRFDHMQQHTGQHLLSAVFEDLFGAKTVSVHFGAAYSTLDLDATIGHSQGARAESRANELVAANRPVRVSYEAAADAAGLRKASDRSGTLRIVSIEDLDRSACGGTHVRATGEIGAVLVRKLEKYKQLTRVEFLCGARATRRARADFDVLTGLAATLTAGIDELPTLIPGMSAQLKELENDRKRLRESLAEFRAAQLVVAAAADASGNRRVVDRTSPVDDLRALAHAVSALPHAVFVGATTDPCTVLVAASPDSGVNAGTALKTALAAVGGRGGGNPRMAQGSVPDAAALDAVVRALTD